MKIYSTVFEKSKKFFKIICIRGRNSIVDLIFPLTSVYRPLKRGANMAAGLSCPSSHGCDLPRDSKWRGSGGSRSSTSFEVKAGWTGARWEYWIFFVGSWYWGSGTVRGSLVERRMIVRLKWILVQYLW